MQKRYLTDYYCTGRTAAQYVIPQLPHGDEKGNLTYKYSVQSSLFVTLLEELSVKMWVIELEIEKETRNNHIFRL